MVHFEGEEGIDSGGLTKDMAIEVSRALGTRNSPFLMRTPDGTLEIKSYMQYCAAFGESKISGEEMMDETEFVSAFHQIGKLLGKPEGDKEYCYYSVPAAPIDNPDKDVIYHRRLFERVISDCGFVPVASNEAMSIIYSQTAKESFSGLALSFGSGMTNIALSNLAIECLSFSVEHGGDWIDQGAARSVGSTAANVCATKESGIDLLDPQGRVEEALSFYYKELIEYVLGIVAKEFKSKQLSMNIQKPLPIVVSGGTSLAGNFLEFFADVFDQNADKFPFEVSEIRHADNPLNAVANGLLIQAMQEE